MKTIRLYIVICLVISACPLIADNNVQILCSDVAIVSIGEERAVNEMAVFPSKGIAGRPLLLIAHGNGGSGPKEIKAWIALSKQHNFTVVCPTFLSAAHSMDIPEDVPYFKNCLHWIEDNLQYDKSNVFMTGVSGGGYAVWYLATTRPDFFKGLFLQSANFAGQYFDLNLSAWREKPIKLIWGSQDLPDIPVQNQKAVNLLIAEQCKNYSTEVVLGGHHQEHPDRVIIWLEQHLATLPSN